MAVVRLVCCPAQTARERRIDRLLREHWGRALLVVPTQRYADDRAAGLLLAGDCPGIWGDLALTFDRFVERLLQGEGLHASAIDNLERKVILRRVLSSLHERGRLGPAGELADSDGLANHLLRIVQQLKQAAVDPEAFRERIAQRTHPSALDDVVSEVYAGYQQTLHERGLYDRIGLSWQANLLCEQREPTYLAQYDAVLLDGFDDFTPSEFRLLHSLSAHLDLLAFGIHYDAEPERADLFAVQHRTINRIGAAFDVVQEQLPAVPPETHSDFAAQHLLWRGDTARLHRDLGSYRPNLVVTPCSDPVHEVETIARRIKTLLVEQSVAANDIVVVYRNLATVGDTLRAVFRESSIPAHVSGQGTLAESAVCNFLLALLEAVTSWDRTSVLEVVSSPWFRPGSEGEDLAKARVLADLAGITDGSKWEDWRKGLVKQLEKGEESETIRRLKRLPNAREAVQALIAQVERLKCLAQILPDHAAIPKHVKDLEEAIEKLDLERAVDRQEVAEIRDMEREALSRFHDLLGVLHEWYRDDPTRIDRADFAAVLRRSMRNVPLAQEQPGHGVLCADVDHIRNLRRPYVFLGGVNEGVIPMPPSLSAIYSEDDVRDLAASGIELESQRERSDRELVRFHHAVSAAQEQLTITWSLRSREDRELRRSPFLSELLRLFEGHAVEEPIPATDAFVPQVVEIGSKRDLRNAILHRAPDSAGQFEEETSAVVAGAAIEAERHRRAPFGAYDGVLTDEAALALLRERFNEERLFSVDQIETYVGCPFQFFVTRVLRVEELAAPSDEVDPQLKGRIVHDVLHAFHRSFEGRPVAEIGSEEADEVMRQILERIVAKHIKGAPEAVRVLLRAEERALERRLMCYLRWERDKGDSTWRPGHFEVSFGRTVEVSHDKLDRPQPFRLDTSAGPVRLSGRIDRIDLSDSGMRVIDYKTGSPPSFTDVRAGHSVQLPVYAMALEHHLAEGTQCSEAQFIEVGHKPKRDFLIRAKPDVWDECLAGAVATVGVSVSKIREGRFPPTPRKDHCAYCAARQVCRHDQSRIDRKLEVES